MGSPGASSGEQATPIQHLQSLYDRHRYLDAFAASAQYWTASTDIERLSTDELILAGRLASRLGGPRLSRWLLRAALKRDPSNLHVRFFTHHLRVARWRLLDDLRAFQNQPDLGGDDPAIRAAWYASYAFTWAALRDYQRASECLERAHELAPDDSWVLSCESNVHGMADRWTEALRSAERAWEIDPGAPFAAVSLGSSLLNLGRVEEAVSRTFLAAEQGQSYEMAGDACWRLCALAETLDGRERRCALERATLLADRLEALAPLADRESRVLIARARLDIAELSDDHAGMERWCDQSRSPFHRQMLANLRRTAQGERLRLPFRRTIQKFETCVPASVAAAMSASGMTISAEEMASEITFGGTPEWAAADWLRARGFHVRSFAVTPGLAATLIRHRIAFVLCWDAEEGGHAVAIVGLDERAGTLLVHDPQSFRTNEYLLAVLDLKLSPAGIKGMAAVVRERAAELDALLPEESAVVEAAQDHQRALFRLGPSAARAIVAEVTERFPSHPGTRFLQAAQSLEDGKAGEALGQLQALLQEFPDAPAVRVRVLAACRALGNTARLRTVLRDIVERGVLPGLEAQQQWIRPPERYVYEYADLLRQSTATSAQAETLLHSLLRRQPTSAGAWHVLADLLRSKPDVEGGLLCHRIASSLAPSDEHYAQAYAAALGDRNREEEAFRWLESRVRSRGSSTKAVGTWVSWIRALEEKGYPERALTACHDAFGHHPRSVDLLAFAVPFFARMGLWEMAEERLLTLKSAGNPAAFHQASLLFLQMRGDLNGAIEHAEAWIAESPHSVDARHGMLQLLATRDGPDAAVERAALWLRANPHHELLEEAYCAQLDRAGSPRWKKYRLLLGRLQRNRDGGWAWAELTLACVLEYGVADDRRRRRLAPRIERFLAECDRTCSDSVPAFHLHALWSEQRGEWTAAVAGWLDSVDRDPGNFYAYDQAWHCAARLPDAERRRTWTVMKRALLNAPGHLSIARPLMALLVERFGLKEAEREIEQWRAERPDDPDVLEAAADLLIEHGHGRSDARRALAMLGPAVQRYPYHPGLRLSLANAHRRAGEEGEAEKVLVEIVRRHPANSVAHIQLAWVRHVAGDRDGAQRTLDAAQASDPQNLDVLAARVQILLSSGRADEARRSIEDGLARMPGNVQWRYLAIRLLMQCRAHDQAIAAAREGVAIYPRGAFLWLLLGRALNDMRRFAVTGEIESSLRRSLALNPGLFESAETLAIWLTEQERDEQAIQVMRDIEGRLTDPSPARGWQAWIKRRQGQQVEAIRELTAVVCDAPWFAWGWRVLAEWLDEDRAWERVEQDGTWAHAWRIMQEVPPQMVTDTAFRRQRLILLKKAGADEARIEAEWNELVPDFPDDPSIQAGLSEPPGQGTVPTGATGSNAFQRIPWWAWWIAMVGLMNLLERLFGQ